MLDTQNFARYVKAGDIKLAAKVVTDSTGTPAQNAFCTSLLGDPFLGRNADTVIEVVAEGWADPKSAIILASIMGIQIGMNLANKVEQFQKKDAQLTPNNVSELLGTSVLTRAIGIAAVLSSDKISEVDGVSFALNPGVKRLAESLNSTAPTPVADERVEAGIAAGVAVGLLAGLVLNVGVEAYPEVEADIEPYDTDDSGAGSANSAGSSGF